MLVGWLWITLGIILQFHPGHDYPRLIPVAFFFTGVSTILVTNRVWIPNYPESVLVTLVGYGIQALVGVVSMIWLLRIFPDQYECTN
jgi:Trk-type K+ transport system membrane component